MALRIPMAVAVLAALPSLGDDGVRLDGAKSDKGVRLHLAGVSVGAGYMHGWPGYGYGPGWYGPGWRWGSPWGLYDPYWYSPWIHPALYGSPARRDSMGEIKFDTKDKNTSVYLDGALAGTTGELKSIYLDPGVYRLEVRDRADRSWEKKVYVLSGKVLRVRPEFR